MTDRERILLEARLLGLKPWELTPCEVHDGPCPYPPGTMGHKSWDKAVQLQKHLDEKLAEGEK